MKRIVFTVALVIGLMTRIFAYDFESGNLQYSIISTNPPEVCLEGSAEGAAFQGELDIPAMVTHDGIEYSVTTIAPYAFWNYDQLIGLHVPASVTHIGYGADPVFGNTIIQNPFVGARNLETITVDTDNPVYYSQGNCIVEEQTATLVVGCNHSVIPGEVEVIGKYAFAACLTKMPIIPPYVKAIGEGAFAESRDTTALLLPNSVKSIGYQAFEYCWFSKVFIPKSVTTIEIEAFGYNHNLQELVLSETVSEIQLNAFCNATNLTTIYSFNPNPPLLYTGVSSSFPNLGSYIQLQIYVPQESIEVYQNAEGWNDFTNYQPLPCWDGTVAEAYEGGDGSVENPFQIATPQQLALLAQQTNTGTGGDANYVLVNDICLNLWTEHNYYDWTPIGKHEVIVNHYFTGSFDGNGKTISGLVHVDRNTNNDNVIGLFGYTDGAVIRNVNLSHCMVTGKEYVGGLVALAQHTTIEDCHVEDAVIGCVESTIFNGGLVAGGIVGFMGEPWPSDAKTADSCCIRNCQVAQDVLINGAAAAGIVGEVNSINSGTPCLISDCVNQGAIESNNWCAGGIVGDLCHATVRNCVNEGFVKAATIDVMIEGGYAGGVVGKFADSNIINCQNIGNVEAKGTAAGGIAAGMLQPETDSLFFVRNCHNFGSVSATAVSLYQFGGGIIGAIQTDTLMRLCIVDCSNHGDVNGVQNAGGIVGIVTMENWDGLSVFNVYNSGNVQSLLFASGLVCGTYGSSQMSSYPIRIRNVYNSGTINNAGGYHQPVIINSTSFVDNIGDSYWQFDEHYCGNSFDYPLRESCAFHPRVSPTQWRLDSVRYNTANLLRALNAGAENLEDQFPEIGSVHRWQEDLDLTNGGFPIFGETAANNTEVFPLRGSEWYYEIQNDNGGVTCQHLEYAADTTVNNKKAKVLVRTNHIYDKQIQDVVSREIVFEEDDMVYWWNAELQQFTVLYDFAAVEGDFWTIQVGRENLLMQVVAEGQYEYEGNTYRMLSVSDEQGLFSGDIVCGIGHLTSFFPEGLMSSAKGYRVEGIRCCWDEGDLVFKFGNRDCDEIYEQNHHGLDENGNENEELVVYPNPTDGLITVKALGAGSSQKYRIANILGQTLMSGVVNDRILDVSALSSGIYFLFINGQTVKLMKQ